MQDREVDKVQGQSRLSQLKVGMNKKKNKGSMKGVVRNEIKAHIDGFTDTAAVAAKQLGNEEHLPINQAGPVRLVSILARTLLLCSTVFTRRYSPR